MKEQNTKTFWLGSAPSYGPHCFPQWRPTDISGPTYLPRIHIYRDTYLSSL